MKFSRKINYMGIHAVNPHYPQSRFNLAVVPSCNGVALYAGGALKECCSLRVMLPVDDAPKGRCSFRVIALILDAGVPAVD
jgi:hypothetical protein